MSVLYVLHLPGGVVTSIDVMVVAPCVLHVDFYEEILSMVELLTANHISANMWKLMSILYTVFTSDGGYDYFGG